MANTARERAAANSAANLAATQEIITDATDADTIAANNMGGAAVPGDMPDDILALFAGTMFDPNATITKATKRATVARRGRTAVSLLNERDVKNLENALTLITGEQGNEEDAEFGFVSWMLHEDYLNFRKQVEIWVDENNISGIPVKVTFAKHKVSPVGHDPKKAAENKGKKLVYVITLSRGEQDDDDSEETETEQ